MNGHDNPTFIGDSVYTIPPGEYRKSITQFYPGKFQQFHASSPATLQTHNDDAKDKVQIDKQKKPPKDRDSWGKGIEFLLSCIAMSGI
jgi:hypothetical protein